MNLELESERLKERIYGAFPVTAQGYAKLLGLLDIEASEAIPTAAVTFGARSRLLINPRFVADKCAADPALVMLVMHELLHVALGHTRLFERMTLARNWAFDCVINAQLCQLFPSPEHTALFRNCYAADKFPMALLRPPEGWRTPLARWLPGAAGKVHRQLYTDTSVSYHALYELLPKLTDAAAIVASALLGNHAEGWDGEADPSLAAELRAIVAEWPMVQRILGRDRGQQLAERSVVVGRPFAQAVGILRAALARLAGLGAMGSVRRSALAPEAAVLPYRTGGDRRAELLDAIGCAPLLFGASLVQPAVQHGERVHVYVDVSGSMDGVAGAVYAALLPLLGWIAPSVHLFSTELADVAHAALRRGIARSTGGTDIAAVTGHMLKHRVRRALLVTDGMVGEAPEDHRRALKRNRTCIEAVITPGGHAHEIAPLVRRTSMLPSLS